MDNGPTQVDSSDGASQNALSYKFQRLREKLRDAIASGDLEGKLPGERALAKRFHVNAKTLSKALTDLAAEGLLDRSIGRGTFVKGSAPAASAARNWLLVCEPGQTADTIAKILSEAHPDLEILTNVSSVRPSLLNQFGAVIVMAENIPDTFIRDLVVRNISVVVVGTEPRTYSTHAVLCDRHLAASQAARDLLLGGHRKLAAVEPPQCTTVADSLRKSSTRYASDAVIEACFPADVAALAHSGITAFVCYSVKIAREVRAELQKRDIAVPGQVSVIAIGTAPDDEAVSGYFVHPAEKVNAVTQLLHQQGTRPSSIWLAGRFVDHGTVASVSMHHGAQPENYHHAAI
jgi:DNA-binding transcriptional regulator YhcF (GntR family)